MDNKALPDPKPLNARAAPWGTRFHRFPKENASLETDGQTVKVKTRDELYAANPTAKTAMPADILNQWKAASENPLLLGLDTESLGQTDVHERQTVVHEGQRDVHKEQTIVPVDHEKPLRQVQSTVGQGGRAEDKLLLTDTKSKSRNWTQMPSEGRSKRFVTILYGENAKQAKKPLTMMELPLRVNTGGGGGSGAVGGAASTGVTAATSSSPFPFKTRRSNQTAVPRMTPTTATADPPHVRKDTRPAYGVACPNNMHEGNMLRPQYTSWDDIPAIDYDWPATEATTIQDVATVQSTITTQAKVRTEPKETIQPLIETHSKKLEIPRVQFAAKLHDTLAQIRRNSKAMTEHISEEKGSLADEGLSKQWTDGITALKNGQYRPMAIVEPEHKALVKLTEGEVQRGTVVETENEADPENDDEPENEVDPESKVDPERVKTESIAGPLKTQETIEPVTPALLETILHPDGQARRERDKWNVSEIDPEEQKDVAGVEEKAEEKPGEKAEEKGHSQERAQKVTGQTMDDEVNGKEIVPKDNGHADDQEDYERGRLDSGDWIKHWAAGCLTRTASPVVLTRGEGRDIDPSTGGYMEPAPFEDAHPDVHDRAQRSPESVWRETNWTSELLIQRELKAREKKIRELERLKLEKQALARLKEREVKVPCVLRAASHIDLAGIAKIYNDEVDWGFKALDTKRVTVSDFQAWLRRNHDQGIPFIVAVKKYVDMTDEENWTDRHAYREFMRTIDGRALLDRRPPDRMDQFMEVRAARHPYMTAAEKETQLRREGEATVTKGQVLGFATLLPMDTGLGIGQGGGASRYSARVLLHVNADYRRLGVGRALLDCMCQMTCQHYLPQIQYKWEITSRFARCLPPNVYNMSALQNTRKYNRIFVHALLAGRRDNDFDWLQALLIHDFGFQPMGYLEESHCTQRGRRSQWLDMAIFGKDCDSKRSTIEHAEWGVPELEDKGKWRYG